MLLRNVFLFSVLTKDTTLHVSLIYCRVFSTLTYNMMPERKRERKFVCIELIKNNIYLSKEKQH